FFKNAAANLASGAGAAILAVALPPFLVRWLSPELYGTWLLLLQIAAYAALLRFGLESVLGRWIAVSLAKDDMHERDCAASAAAVILFGGSVAACAGIGLTALFLASWFPSLPPPLVSDARAALLIVGVTFALSLPVSAINGVFAGYERYEVPGILNLAGKLVIAAATLLAAHHRPATLTDLAWAWAAANAAQWLATWICLRRLIPDLRIHWSFCRFGTLRCLLAECLPLGIWNLAMLMINGLDVVLVGRLDFSKLAYYTLAANLVALISGVSYAIFTSLVPVGATMSVGVDAPRRLQILLLRASRGNTLILLAAGMPLLLLPLPLLRLWIGSNYAIATAGLLQILVAGNILRLVAVPYSLLLVSTGQQHRVLVTPLLEGAVNLSASIWLGARIGAAGVAWATLLGAVLGFASHLFYNMPRTTRIAFNFAGFAREALWRPVLPCLPAMIWASARSNHPLLGRPWVGGAAALV